jgi:hypothetical protein
MPRSQPTQLERRATPEANRQELDKVTKSIKEIIAMIEDGGSSRALRQEKSGSCRDRPTCGSVN